MSVGRQEISRLVRVGPYKSDQTVVVLVIVVVYYRSNGRGSRCNCTL